MSFILSFAAALFLTTVLIPLIMKVSAPLGLIDSPADERKVHTTAIPRSGGLAIALGVIPVVYWLPFEGYLQGLFVGSLIIACFGMVDDRSELNYKWKFLGQILAVVVAMSGGILIDQVPFAGLESASLWVSVPLTFLFILGVTNAVNLSDGLDGLAAGTTLMALGVVTFFAIQSDNAPIALIALAVIGALLGFLRFNTHPARIFMGDTGSQFLGFMAACLCIQVTQYEFAPLSPTLPLLVLGLPILDTLSVMAVRLKEGRSPFAPDKNHLHHQFMKLGFRHNEAVAAIYVLQAVLIVLTYFLCYQSDMVIVGVYAIFCTIFLGSMWLLRKSGWVLHDEVVQDRDAGYERRSIVLQRIRWFYGVSSYTIQLAVGAFLVACALRVEGMPKDFGYLALIACGGLLVAWRVYHGSIMVLTRLMVYTASVFAAYALFINEARVGFDVVVDGYLVGVAVLLAVAIRMTRREDFRLDNQDILIMFIVLVVPQLPFESLSEFSVGQITLRLCVLLYACEFLINKKGSNLKIINGSALASLLILGLGAV